MTTPAVALNVPNYAFATPYLTGDEYLTEPTGVNVSQLIPGGDEDMNRAALDTVILDASAYADELAGGKVLAATTDIQAGDYRIFRDGTIRVPLDYTPVIEVLSVQVGRVAGQLRPLPDLSTLWFQRKVIVIPVTAAAAAGRSAGPVVAARDGRMFAAVEYVNGWTNTTLAAAAAAAATSVTVGSAVGVVPGLPLKIYDGPATELVTVAGSYVSGSSTVPLTVPLASGHTAGVAISALPRSIKRAVVALTTHLIKTRGAESLILSKTKGGPDKTDKNPPGSTAELEQAVALLANHKRVW